ncbi:MAG: hypothetical protein ACOYB2_10695 [Limnohabitans sp.]
MAGLTRAEKRRRAAGYDHAQVDLGNGMVQASPASVMAALERLGPESIETFEDVKDRIVPMFPRFRPMPPFAGEPMTVTMAGVAMGFGLDVGPAMLVVADVLHKAWDVPAETIADAAVANARRAVATCGKRDVIKQEIDGTPIKVLQTGLHLASTVLLMPDEIVRLFGPGPKVLTAPMRDLLVAFEPTVDLAFAVWLRDEFASMDPNGLAAPMYAFDGAMVTPFFVGSGLQ